jgi:hypothetical protein
MSENRSLDEILKSVREKAVGHSATPAEALHSLSDQSVQMSYENIRQQVAADRQVGPTYRLLGNSAQQRSELLRAEMVRRGMRFDAIIWP